MDSFLPRFPRSVESAFGYFTQNTESIVPEETDLEIGLPSKGTPSETQPAPNPAIATAPKEARSHKGWKKVAVTAVKNLLGATGTAMGGIFGSLQGKIGAATGAFGGAALAELLNNLITGLTASRKYKHDMEAKYTIIKEIFKKNTFDIIKVSLAAIPTALLPILVTDTLVEHWTDLANMTMDDFGNMTTGEPAMYNLTSEESAIQMGAAGLTSALTNFVALLVLRGVGKAMYSKCNAETPDSAKLTKEEIAKDALKLLVAIPSDLATASAAATIFINFALHAGLSSLVSTIKIVIETKQRRKLKAKVVIIFAALVKSVNRRNAAKTAIRQGHAPFIRRGTIANIIAGHASLSTSLSTPELRKLKNKARNLKAELESTPTTPGRTFTPWQILDDGEIQVTGQAWRTPTNRETPEVYSGRSTPKCKIDHEEHTPIPLNIDQISPISILDMIIAFTKSRQKFTPTAIVSELTPPAQRSPLPIEITREIPLDEEGFPIIELDPTNWNNEREEALKSYFHNIRGEEYLCSSPQVTTNSQVRFDFVKPPTDEEMRNIFENIATIDF